MCRFNLSLPRVSISGRYRSNPQIHVFSLDPIRYLSGFCGLQRLKCGKAFCRRCLVLLLLQSSGSSFDSVLPLHGFIRPRSQKREARPRYCRQRQRRARWLEEEQSVAGCPFGEGCHFLHYVPGGINAVAQMDLPLRSPITGPVHYPDGPSLRAVKTRICNNFTSSEGCRFGDKCHFAHGERELGRPINSAHGPSNRADPASFGASATAKISIDASLAGAVIGKGGVNAKQICRLTGAKLTIRDHETDEGLRNIELEGSFDQIKQASGMVRELIFSISSDGGMTAPPVHGGGSYKTKLCENFAKGPCTFGDRCKFAHGAAELRKA